MESPNGSYQRFEGGVDIGSGSGSSARTLTHGGELLEALIECFHTTWGWVIESLILVLGEAFEDAVVVYDGEADGREKLHAGISGLSLDSSFDPPGIEIPGRPVEDPSPPPEVVVLCGKNVEEAFGVAGGVEN